MPFADSRGPGLFLDAGLAQSEYRVTAVALVKSLLLGNLFYEAFDLSRRKLYVATAVVANEMQMIRLPEHRFVACHPLQFGLAHESGSQEDFQSAVHGRDADPVALG